MMDRNNYAVAIVFVLISTCVCRAAPGGEPTRKCQEITIPMCRGIGYNYTYMPNQFEHMTQDEAGLEVHQFWPLVQINCSVDLKFFLCSMYAPICINTYTQPLQACRSVCQRARDGCINLMRSYGFEWPMQLDCDRLPEFGNSNVLCMDSNQTDKNSQQKPHPHQPGQYQPPPSPIGRTTTQTAYNFDHRSDLKPHKTCRSYCNASREFLCRNSSYGLVNVDRPDPETKHKLGGIAPGCRYRCRESLGLKKDDHLFMQFWIGLWAVLCCASTLLTILTFSIDMSRFRYPERPIIFLSFCYFMVSIGYIIRLAAGHDEVACENDYVRTQTTGPALCTIVFILIYFFGMASSVWWVNLSLTWFLAAGLKWSNEAIAGYSQYFHIFAWFLPSIKTVAILTLSAVDGDPVSGVCYVGNMNVTMQRFFVLGPLFAYLVLGSFFLLSGFVSLFRIHNIVKQQHGGVSKIEKLEHLMVRIGIFSVLYTIPATIVVGCYFYEQHFREAWEFTALCEAGCKSTHPIASAYMDFNIFALKYFMCLVVGITSGIWIWSPKTVTSWRRFFAHRCCGRYGRPETGSVMLNGAAATQQLLLGSGANGHQPLIGIATANGSPRDFYEYGGGGASVGLLRSKGPPSTVGGYVPTEAMIIKSHTDVSSGCYSRQYPVNHV